MVEAGLSIPPGQKSAMKTRKPAVENRRSPCYYRDTMMTEDTILLLARELEWAEAYREEFPDCELGRFYFHLLERELEAAERGRVGFPAEER